MAKQIFLSDKAFSRLVAFIAERHFTYMIDTEIEPDRDVEHVIDALNPKYQKSLEKLRKSFVESGADFNEFHELFYEGDFAKGYRHDQIREVFKRYYPESMRDSLGTTGVKNSEETIMLPKELFRLVSQLLEMDSAYDRLSIGTTWSHDYSYDIDFQERRSELRSAIEKMLQDDEYANYSDAINDLLYSVEENEVTRVHEFKFRFSILPS